MDALNSSPVTSVQIKQWTSKDPVLSNISDLVHCRHGGPRDKTAISAYHKYWKELSVKDGCLLCGNRVVVPTEGRHGVMELLHEGHPGNNWMKGLAHSFV